MEYLEHIITIKRIATNPSKVQAVEQWPIPKNMKELRGFLGLAGYYRRFIKHYGIISRPLTKLLKKGVPFIWSPNVQAAFDGVKQALVLHQFWPCLTLTSNLFWKLMRATWA